VGDAAAALGVTPSTVRAQIDKGQLACLAIDGRNYISEAELERYHVENQARKRQKPRRPSPGLAALAAQLGSPADDLALRRRLHELAANFTGNEAQADRLLIDALRVALALERQNALSGPSFTLKGEIEAMLVRLSQRWPTPGSH